MESQGAGKARRRKGKKGEAHFLNHSNPACHFPGHSSASGLRMSTVAAPVVESVPARETPESPEQALVTSAQTLESGLLTSQNSLAARLPVEVDVAIPLRDFRVRNLLALEPGTVVASQWVHGEDVPLSARAVQLAWSEFEVADTQLAVRLTRLV